MCVYFLLTVVDFHPSPTIVWCRWLTLPVFFGQLTGAYEAIGIVSTHVNGVFKWYFSISKQNNCSKQFLKYTTIFFPGFSLPCGIATMAVDFLPPDAPQMYNNASCETNLQIEHDKNILYDTC